MYVYNIRVPQSPAGKPFSFPFKNLLRRFHTYTVIIIYTRAGAHTLQDVYIYIYIYLYYTHIIMCYNIVEAYARVHAYGIRKI